jgi:hypothetical protein
LPYWIVAMGVFAAIAWAWYPQPEPPPPSPAVEADAAEIAAANVPTPTAPLRPPGVDNDTPASVVPARPTEPKQARPRKAPRPARSRRLRKRAVPAGTSEARADAFRNLPHGRGDGRPMGGIGGEGVHVDHLALGARYRNGTCTGASDGFSTARHDKIHACIRVVHRRVGQRVAVRWERDGHLVRRQWLWIPASHAFRTRASMPVRTRFRGNWTVRVLSDDGVELAAHDFVVSD